MAKLDIEQTVRNLAKKALDHNYLGKPIRQWADEIAKRTAPKMVIYQSNGYADGAPVYDMADCPDCGAEFCEEDITWRVPFCPHCGQALKWDNDEEGEKE